MVTPKNCHLFSPTPRKEEPTIETFENAMDEKEVKIGKARRLILKNEALS